MTLSLSPIPAAFASVSILFIRICIQKKITPATISMERLCCSKPGPVVFKGGGEVILVVVSIDIRVILIDGHVSIAVHVAVTLVKSCGSPASKVRYAERHGLVFRPIAIADQASDRRSCPIPFYPWEWLRWGETHTEPCVPVASRLPSICAVIGRHRVQPNPTQPNPAQSRRGGGREDTSKGRKKKSPSRYK
ncbi:uncharacterized protein BJ171DRAFT_204839 [Polychytrium aggregatum]|uniref:uncharacterized protein n=1 Tax=Polychytrium aggregatum TaxID=110093 RepID=UPI0022FE6687|nr:uncharacterized protein BJ171DRAFT_204839 [Polychytrium aggregatum]KAI9199598.1 hypothetical protein BJ171DRAFT_204839 [Polychytrium aggregatum]